MEAMEPDGLKRLLDSDEAVKLIDVREQQEWDICHIEGAELKPLSQIQNWADDLAKEEGSLIIYCHHGMRSAQACMYLTQLGAKRTINLTGGIHLWAHQVDPSMPSY